MALVDVLFWKLASAGAKAGLKAWLAEGKPAQVILDAAVDPILDQLKAWPAKGLVEATRDRTAKELRSLFGERTPERDRDANEALRVVTTTLERAELSAASLIASRLDAVQVGDRLVELAREDEAWGWLNPSQRTGTEAILRAVAKEVCARASELSGFSEALAETILKALDRLTQNADRAESADAQFEAQYRKALAAQLDRMELFGLDTHEVTTRYPLSIAYVRLQLRSDPDAAVLGRDTPAEEVLAPLEQVTVLGGAGSGKSTLLQWLAVHAARGDFTGPLAAWNDRIPFFIRLRSWVAEMRQAQQEAKRVSGPRPEQWIPEILSGAMPSRWVHDRLSEGRALLLIDGVDEVPADLREAVRDWIQELQTLGGRFLVVSSRPYLERNWLEGFPEFRIAPLDLGGALELVTRWHAAVARQERDAERRALLPAREAALRAALEVHGPLRDLVNNPLLCAMICALHHRNVDLPKDRISLYERCCNALIHEREKLRGLEIPESVRWLSPLHKMLLLERMAYWMIRNGHTEVEVSRLDGWLAGELPGMPQCPPDVTAEQVRRYFVERSGLLCEPVPGVLEFVHKTFMEFLAARAAVKAEDYGVLVQHGDDDEWTELIRLAAGCIENPKRSSELLNGLLDPRRKKASWFSGWRGGDGTADARRRRELLAISCLETCPQVESAMRERLARVLESLIPPSSPEAAQSLAAAGTLALPFLAPRSEWEGITRAQCVSAVARIGGEPALSLLEQYAPQAADLTLQALIGAWSSFDSAEYARRVLSVALQGQTSFRPRGVITLAGLEALPWLETLDLSDCPAVTDVAPIAALPRLRAFTNKDGAEMVWVPPGAFMMGSAADDPEAGEDERPAHRVRITRGFWLSRTPVTNAQYRRFVQATGHREPALWHNQRFCGDAQPVVGVSWKDAVACCAWAGGRLPTEAEWEYAARGPESRRYPWGDVPPTPEHADFEQDWGKGPLPVGSKPAGAAWCGALDLAGSVWEWCADWCEEGYYRQSPECDPSGPATGEWRVVRGGSWTCSAKNLRTARRSGNHPERRNNNLGFRCMVGGGADPLPEGEPSGGNRPTSPDPGRS